VTVADFVGQRRLKNGDRWGLSLGRPRISIPGFALSRWKGIGPVASGPNCPHRKRRHDAKAGQERMRFRHFNVFVSVVYHLSSPLSSLRIARKLEEISKLSHRDLQLLLNYYILLAHSHFTTYDSTKKKRSMPPPKFCDWPQRQDVCKFAELRSLICPCLARTRSGMPRDRRDENSMHA
jgi:hypothetical protein